MGFHCQAKLQVQESEPRDINPDALGKCESPGQIYDIITNGRTCWIEELEVVVLVKVKEGFSLMNVIHVGSQWEG